MKFLSIYRLTLILCVILGCAKDEQTSSEPFVVTPSEDMGMTDTAITRPEGCLENGNLANLLPVLMGGKTHPTGRGEHDAVYEHCNDRIVLFGGNDFQPEECADFGPKRFSDETWVYSLQYENWVRLSTANAPSPRGRHTMAFDEKRKRMLLFGGRFRAEDASPFDNYELYKDLWAFNVNTDQWVEIETTGRIPAARTNSAMIYDTEGDRLVLFGGSIARTGTEFLPLNDTSILDLEYKVWRRIDAEGPAARLFHRLVYLRGRNAVFLYGGGGANAFVGPFMADAWILDLETETWRQVWDRNSGFGPYARINPSLVYDEEAEQVIMFAGHDDTNVGHRNDVWTFDLNTEEWTLINGGDTGAGEGCARFCSCPPDFVSVDVDSPERRQYHTFTPIPAQRAVYLFGGKGDCGYLDDTWRFDLNALSWEELDAAGQGEACMRTGQEGCTDLCY